MPGFFKRAIPHAKRYCNLHLQGETFLQIASESAGRVAVENAFERSNALC